ncbi:MAG: hypothetical protein A2017_06625 [Lentisphaerae bacterium GWF2_44_16]|nr:MAG: hypothetical protein A2017_06625 [Lentisphaerae bacterium GWF2_44_16]
MNITGEMLSLFFITLSAICAFGAFFLKRIDQHNERHGEKIDRLGEKIEHVQATIGDVKKDYVTHKVCGKRRKKCPCVKEIKKIEKMVRA